MEMNGFPFCDWLKIYKLYTKDNGCGEKKILTPGKNICYWVNLYSIVLNEEVDHRKIAENLYNAHKINAVKWYIFILFSVGKC